MSVDAMMEEIGKLDTEAKFELAWKIWDSIDTAAIPQEPTVGQQAELTRRTAELDADPSIGITWEEVLRRVRAKT
jgi:putative addiction module component (TIGR02574 family)